MQVICSGIALWGQDREERAGEAEDAPVISAWPGRNAQERTECSEFHSPGGKGTGLPPSLTPPPLVKSCLRSGNFQWSEGSP